MDLVEGQGEICSFRTEAEAGMLGTTRQWTDRCQHEVASAWACRRLWLNVLLQCAAEAEGEAMEDVEDLGARELVKKAAQDYLYRPDPDLYEVAGLVGLSAQHIVDLVKLETPVLLRNLRAFETGAAQNLKDERKKERKNGIAI